MRARMDACLHLRFLLAPNTFFRAGERDSFPQTLQRAKSFPFPQHEEDLFILSIRNIFPLILILAYMYTALSLVCF